MHRSRGFTLIELMVAAAIMSIVMIGLMQTLSTNQKAYTVVEQVSEAQQNLRVVADLIERDVRLAGYMVPSHAAVCGVDSTNGPDTLFVSNADVILPVNELETANYSALVASELGAVVTGAGTGPGGNIGGAGRNLPVQNRWLDVAANGTDFSVNQGLILVDRNDPNGRSACGVITALNAGAGDTATITVDFLTNSLGPMSASPAVWAIPAHVYQLTPANAGAGTPAQLFRDGLLLANDVEDLQISYFFDANGDHVMDAGEYQGDTGDAVGNGVAVPYDATTSNGRVLRQVEVNIITATRDNDPNQNATLQVEQITGNRAPGTRAAPDRKRRRVYTATVRLRNV